MTAPAAAEGDKTTLYGVLGIVLSLCCVPVGVIFAILSMMEAKKSGKSAALAYVGFILAALVIVGNIAWFASGGLTAVNR